MASLLELLTLGMLQFCVVRTGEVRIIERRGKFARVATPGVSLLLALFGAGDRIGKFQISKIIRDKHGFVHVVPQLVEAISTKMQVDDYPKESVITRDNATVHIDAVVYYKVLDPERAVYEVNDFVAALQKLVQSALRDEVGKYELDELLVSREAINTRLRTQLDEATDPWGIKVDRVEIKDIDLGEFGKILAEQRAAETRRRTEITEAEGLKRAAILKAEGMSESAVLEAKADKEAMILRAEAHKTAAILAAEARATGQVQLYEAEARGMAMIKAVFEGDGQDEALIQVLAMNKAKEVGAELAAGQATKFFLPADIQSLFGLAERFGGGRGA